MLIELVAVSAAILFSIMFPQELPLSKHYSVLAWLPSITPPKPPAVKPVRQIPAPRVVIPKLKAVPLLEFPAPAVTELKPPKPPVVSITVPAPPTPFAQPTPSPKPKEQAAVRTGTFGATDLKVTTTRRPDQVQTGGFGSPEGFRGDAKGDSLGNVPRLGSFGLPDGPGVGNGTGGRHGIQGVVASAGFGNGGGAGGAGTSAGSGAGSSVAVGGFEKTHQVASTPGQKPVEQAAADFQPIEILFKPTPLYTDEARHLGIEGDVVFSVVFQANGAIRITGLVKSLGHGLDKTAEQAASQIRFKPAQRAGQAVDFPATVHIEFRLAEHSS